jgi:hypothetical protein
MEISFLTFFLGAVDLGAARFSGLGPMLMLDRPTSLPSIWTSDMRTLIGACSFRCWPDVAVHIRLRRDLL